MARTLYSGQPGMGEAYLLQGNPALDIFANQVSQQHRAERMAALQRQKQLAEQQQNITDNLAKISPGEYWMNHDKEIQGEYKSLLDYGTQLKNQNKDPFADTAFLRMRENLVADARFSKQLQEEYNKQLAEINKNPNGYENLDKWMGYYSPNRSLREYRTSGSQAPQLKRAYTLSDIIKENDIKAAPIVNNDGSWETTDVNRPAVIDKALSVIDSPSAKYYLNKKGLDFDAYAEGFPTTSNGKRLWNTNDASVSEIAKNVKAYDPDIIKYLGNKGYDVSTENKADESLKSFIKKQNSAVGDYLNDVVNGAIDDVRTGRKRVYDAERMSIARNKESRAQSTFSKSQQDQEFLTQLKSGLKGGDTEAMRRFNALLQPLNGNAQYDQNGLIVQIPIVDKDIKVTPDGRYVDQNGIEVKNYKPQVRRFKIGRNAGMQGDLSLDNIFKELNLLKDSSTPNEYSGELDGLGGVGTFDDL